MIHPFYFPILFLTLATACRSDSKTLFTEDTITTTVQDQDGDGYIETEDCDDSNALIHTGMQEVCDGVDNNCDGQIDEGVNQIFYQDEDGDGFGGSVTSEACEPPTGYVPNGNDCDDLLDDVYPGAPEACDNLDNDCDGEIDEDAGLVLFADNDGDGFGDPQSPVVSCDTDNGAVENATDCDDTDATIFPGATEICDGVDNNCDGQIDDGEKQLYFYDQDGDGFGNPDQAVESCASMENYVLDNTDCDDLDTQINPAALEYCDMLDNNCDGQTDESTSVDATTWYTDADADGFGSTTAVLSCSQPTGTSSNNLDCDDVNNQIYPAAAELCNGLDDDCDGVIDPPTSLNVSSWYADNDNDGFGDPNAVTTDCSQPSGHVSDSTDCDDTNAALNPNTIWYMDSDADGQGNAAYSLAICQQPAGYVDNANDCNDQQSVIYLGAPEVCDELDNDCDGLVDMDDSDLDTTTMITFYEDLDGDGFGDSTISVIQCTQPIGYSSSSGDCETLDAAYYPGASPGCDGQDYNCDGLVDNDDDGDGYADITCGGDDCDDSNAAVKPEFGGGCALGTTCLDVLNNGYSQGDDYYTIDPDGYNNGLSPFEVYCDMTTDGGGWTEIAYAADLPFQQWFTTGDAWNWIPNDFTFDLADAQITAIQGLSTSGKQRYVGRCNHVIHYYYQYGGNYNYALGFAFFDGTQTPRGSSSYSPYQIQVVSDGCAVNGGEGGSLSQTTIFDIDSVLVPIRNIQCLDCGDGFPEQLGSNLTDNPAWLR